MRWLFAFGVAVLFCGATLADEARPLRVEAATLVQAAAKEASVPERLKLLEQARGKLFEIGDRYPSESAKFQVYVWGKRTTFSPERLDTIIMELRLSGLDTAEIREVLGRQLSATAVDEDGWTDLHYAASLNRPDLVGVLLDSGAKIDARDISDEQQVSNRLGQFLTSLGSYPTVDSIIRIGYEPLHIAAMGNAVDAAKVLLERGADIHAKSEYGDTPLSVAVWSDDAVDTAKVLIEHGADIHTKDQWGWTPLHHAASWNAADTFSLLTAHGADIHAKSDDGDTPLSAAVSFNAVDTAKVLIELGADIDSRNQDGGTLLHRAADCWSSDCPDVASLLLEHGADIHAVDVLGRTPLQTALEKDRAGTVAVLRKWGATR